MKDAYGTALLVVIAQAAAGVCFWSVLILAQLAVVGQINMTVHWPSVFIMSAQSTLCGISGAWFVLRRVKP